MFDRQTTPRLNRVWQPNRMVSGRGVNSFVSVRWDEGTQELKESAIEPQVQPEDEVAHEVATSTETVTEPLLAESLAAETQTQAAPVEEFVIEEVIAAPVPEPEPEPEPVIVGIDLNEAARCDAEQFARGIEQGEQQAREALAQEVAAQRAVLTNVTQELQALLNDPKRFFEPMKRLCLHLAEQITLSELRTSSHAIEQLIQRCLDARDDSAQGMVVVELHPQDLELLQKQGGDGLKALRLEAVSDLMPGSVRLHVNDDVVEDLIQNRLEALASLLDIKTEAWREHSALLPVPLPAHDLEHDDVHHS